MIKNALEIEKETAYEVARLMAVAARTAPKGCGIDNLEIIIVDGEEKAALSKELRKITQDTGVDFFARDAANLEVSHVVLIVGTSIKPIDCPNCGFCGYKNCGENRKNNGRCAFNLGDLGIAIGSAVSVAANHRCDNRVLFSAGKAALNLGFLSPEIKVAYAIPLSVSGKSPFFDR